MPLTRELGAFVAAPHLREIARARRSRSPGTGFIDTIATMIAGSRDEAPQLLRQGAAPAARRGDALFHRRDRAGARGGLDQRHRRARARLRRCRGARPPLDRTGAGDPRRGRGAWQLGRGEMIAAYVAGYEAWAELARRDPGHHHRKGWHPTGIFGAIAAAAACASLRRLDAGKATMALALVGLAGRRADGQFRHDDQAVPRRARGPFGSRFGADGRSRVHRRGGRDRAPAGFLSAVSPEGQWPTATARPPAASATGTSSGTGSASRNTRPATRCTAASTACSICSRSAR